MSRKMKKPSELLLGLGGTSSPTLTAAKRYPFAPHEGKGRVGWPVLTPSNKIIAKVMRNGQEV